MWTWLLGIAGFIAGAFLAPSLWNWLSRDVEEKSIESAAGALKLIVLVMLTFLCAFLGAMFGAIIDSQI